MSDRWNNSAEPRLRFVLEGADSEKLSHLTGSCTTAVAIQAAGNRTDEEQAFLPPEYWWLEAASSSDLRITGNTITDCGGIPIRVEATGGNGDIASAGAHRNITVTGNTVQGCAMPGILVTSTAGLRIENNTLGKWTESSQLPGLMRKTGLIELKPVVEIQCAPWHFEPLVAGP